MDLVRRILDERVDVLKMRGNLAEELRTSSATTHRLKADLLRMQDQAGVARSKKGELVRQGPCAAESMYAPEASGDPSEADAEDDVESSSDRVWRATAIPPPG